MARRNYDSAAYPTAAPLGRPAIAPETAADALPGNRPLHRIRLGFCQAAIWENQSEYGVRYSVSLDAPSIPTTKGTGSIPGPSTRATCPRWRPCCT